MQRFQWTLLWWELCLILVGAGQLLVYTSLESAADDSSISTEADVKPSAFDQNRAFTYLEKQCEFGPRFPGSKAHQETQVYLFSELQKFADEVKLQPFDFHHGNQTIRMNNILARFGEERGEKLLLAAHWDTRPFADKDPKPANRNQPIIGANDGASGVAVLLEIARVLKSKSPPRQVFIVLFDGEDYGKTVENMFLGSKHFARNMGRWQPDFGILLDMIGDRNLELPMELFSWNADRELTESIWRRAQELGLFAFQPRLGVAVLDDHLPLIQAGVPAVNIIDFDYPHWHTLADTPDKCSAESLGVVGQLMLNIIYSGL
jgi:hypothetical protein